MDMEGGVNHFGRGVEKYIDTVFILVEPTFASIALSGKINFLAQGSGVQNIGVILKKVASEEIEDRLYEELKRRNIEILGTTSYDEKIFKSCLAGRVLERANRKKGIR